MARTARPADDLSWADHLVYMEAGAEPGTSAGRRAPGPWPGLLLCAALAAGAIALARAPIPPFTNAAGRHPIDAVMIAIPLGMLLGHFWSPGPTWRAGIQLAVQRVLPVGIVLLGTRLDLRELVALGSVGLGLSLGVILVAVGLLWGIGRRLGLSFRMAALLGVGTAVCGGSAIVAVAPVIEAEEREMLLAIATVALVGLVAMFVLPVLGHALGLDPAAFGFWAGLTIHQTPQVVAAGFAYGPEAGEVATVVKLIRICLLAPVVFAASVLYQRFATTPAAGTTARPRSLPRVPGFVIGLVAMAAGRTLGVIPDVSIRLPEGSMLGAGAFDVHSVDFFLAVSMVCIVTAMAGVGLETRLRTLRESGLRPLAAAGLGAVGVVALALASIAGLGVGGG
jgi:uncharacterized integral membrane protein (TIGR00698 family)